MSFSPKTPAELEFAGAPFFPTVARGQQARGCILPGSDGIAYLDFTAGMGAALLGYQHPGMQAALPAQLAGAFPQPAGLSTTPIWQTLVDRLRDLLPAHLNRIFPCADGHTALRRAIALARELTGRRQVLALHPSATYAPGTISVPFPRPDSPDQVRDAVAPTAVAPTAVAATAVAATIEALHARLAGDSPAHDMAAVIVPAGLEVEAGGMLLPPTLLPAIQDFCDRHGLLMILDERETGGGRTGRVFSALNEAPPDMVILGGPLMAGLPLGLLLLPEALADHEILGPAGGDGLGAAAAVATLTALQEEDLLTNVVDRGAQLRAGLQGLQAVYPFFHHIRGEGLFIGLEIGVPGRGPDADLAHRIQAACLDRGLVLQVGGPDQNILAWLPPLVVGESEISTALECLDDALEEIFED
jgi:4-aminobutyrate aminotransferase